MSSVGWYRIGRVRVPTVPGTMIDAHVADAVAEGVVDADVGGVARTEVVAGDDDQLGVGGVSEAFGERGPSAAHAIRCSRPTDRCRRLRRSRAACDELVGVGDVRCDGQRTGVTLRDDLAG